MDITAFQPNAFQNNAFQIFETEVNSGEHRLINARINNYFNAKRVFVTTNKELVENIKQAKGEDLDADTRKKIVSVIEPFILPKTAEQAAKRASANRIIEDIPPLDVEWISPLLSNNAALAKLNTIFEQANLRRRLQEEEEEIALVLLLMSEE